MKRLIVCCDGTWQDLKKDYPTNVVKMVEAIQPVDTHNVHQIVYYDDGLGTKLIDTGFSLIDTLVKFGGGALGLGIDYKIQNAYRFLCLNFEPDDEIYLFGFSRGAYTVRCLAGLIYNSGLLRRKFIRKIPEAYELYRDKKDPGKAPKGQEAIDFRNEWGNRVPIKVLGCWDTVASLGIPNLIRGLNLDEQFNERYRFYDSTINQTIEKAFHAVAVDEIRKVFDVTLMDPDPARTPDQLTQLWFPGGHGCVGGGSREERGLSDGALLWMLEQVRNLGLGVDEECVEYGIQPDHLAPFNNELKFPFDVVGRNIREVKGGFCAFHESVKKRWKDDEKYRPLNLLKFQQDFDAWTEKSPKL